MHKRANLFDSDEEKNYNIDYSLHCYKKILGGVIKLECLSLRAGKACQATNVQTYLIKTKKKDL
jgi:hypothetical protein